MKITKKGSAVVALSAATVASFLVVFADEWGPYGCVGACNVSIPAPDSTTRSTLDRLSGVVGIGDMITVCNGDFCSIYKVSSNHGYLGQSRTPRNPPGEEVPDPPPLGGGGNGGGSGGGGSPPGGGYVPPGAGATPPGGTVIVSPPQEPPGGSNGQCRSNPAQCPYENGVGTSS